MATSDPRPFVAYDPADEQHGGARAAVESEYAAIHERRRLAGDPLASDTPGRPPQLTGLALSGGGIRSASFALGVLQALAHAGWLRRVDYLSTVSGGGYIGASLTWLLHRAWPAPDAPAVRRAPGPARDQADDKVRFGVSHDDFPYGLYPVGGTRLGASSQALTYRGRLLRYLRQNGRYLTPGQGITTLSLLAVLLRNMLYSLAVYGGLLLGLFLLLGPWLYRLPGELGWTAWAPSPQQPVVLNLALVLTLLLAASVPCYAVWTAAAHRSAQRQYGGRRAYERIAGAALGVLLGLLVLAALPAVHHALNAPAAAPAGKQYVVQAEMPAAAASMPRLVVSERPAPPDPGLQQKWAALTGGLSALLGVASSVGAFMRSQSTRPTGRRLPMALLVTVGTAALAFGVLLLVYDAFDRLDRWFGDASWAYLPTVLGLLLGTALLARLVNTNYMSVHRYYRDRLMETFMPDVADALQLHGVPKGVAAAADVARLHELWPPQDGVVPGPYPIINTNVILASSCIPKFRGRGGDNFIFSPRYSGSNATGWRETRSGFGWMTLASAMAISGAAVNPNTGASGQGVTRQPLLSFLMGLLNIRLGYWVINPMPRCRRLVRLARQGRGRHVSRALLWLAEHLSPQVPNALWPGLSELFLRRDLDENSHLLQLSDGGHFENLGLYELLRRRLSLIIVSDAGADADYSFAELANAIEKVRADFGVIIDIDAADLERLTPRAGSGYDTMKYAERGYLVARITYPVGDDGPRHGTLIYLTTTFFRSLSADLYGYRRAHPDFPDQPTADQFFDERQFDAYRELGFQTAWQMLGSVEVQTNAQVRQRMGPPPWRPGSQPTP